MFFIIKLAGGESPPTNGRDRLGYTGYSEQQLQDVITLLQNTHMGQKKIAELTNSSIDFVSKVNIGYNKPKNQILIYPLRKGNYVDHIFDEIIEDLQTTETSQKEIAKKFGVARSTVTMINIGKNHHKDNLSYPIRKLKSPIKNKIQQELINTQLNCQEIATKYKVTLAYIYIIRNQLKETCND